MALEREELEAFIDAAADAEFIDYGDADVVKNYGSQRFFAKIDSLITTALATAGTADDLRDEMDNELQLDEELFELSAAAEDSDLSANWMHLIDSEHKVLDKVQSLVYDEASVCYKNLG